MKTHYQYLSKSANTPSTPSEYLYRKGSYDYSRLSASRHTTPSFTKTQLIENPPLFRAQHQEQSNPQEFSTNMKKIQSKYSSLRQTLDTNANTKLKYLITKNDKNSPNSTQQNTSSTPQIYDKNKCQTPRLDQKYQDAIEIFQDYLDDLKNLKYQLKKFKDQKKFRKQLSFFKNHSHNQTSSTYSSTNGQSNYSLPDYKQQNQQTNQKNNYTHNDDLQSFKKIKTPIGLIPMTPNSSTFDKKFNFYPKPRENHLLEQPSHNQCKITLIAPSTPSNYYSNKYNQFSQSITLPSTPVYSDNHIKYNNKQKYYKQQKYETQIHNFIFVKIIGEGRFGVVYQAIHQPTGWIFAIKKVSKSIIKKHQMVDQFILQLKLQTYLNHENILPLYTQFDDKDSLYLVLQYMEDSTLFNYLKKFKKLPEMEVATKIKQITSAVKYLHENQIAHRDIKPQNIVMSHGVCKLCDFGWATICSERRKTYCGTFDYAPPQILQGAQYDYTADLWCLGVLTYELLVGKAPFYHISRKQTMKKILNVQKTNIEFPSTISKSAINFIDNLIKKDPKQRLSSEMLLEHPFLKQKPKNGIHKY